MSHSQINVAMSRTVLASLIQIALLESIVTTRAAVSHATTSAKEIAMLSTDPAALSHFWPNVQVIRRDAEENSHKRSVFYRGDKQKGNFEQTTRKHMVDKTMVLLVLTPETTTTFHHKQINLWSSLSTQA